MSLKWIKMPAIQEQLLCKSVERCIDYTKGAFKNGKKIIKNLFPVKMGGLSCKFDENFTSRYY
ncbi:MAG: hypothetical protein ABIA63_14815 [bacterium]